MRVVVVVLERIIVVFIDRAGVEGFRKSQFSRYARQSEEEKAMTPYSGVESNYPYSGVGLILASLSRELLVHSTT